MMYKNSKNRSIVKNKQIYLLLIIILSNDIFRCEVRKIKTIIIFVFNYFNKIFCHYKMKKHK